MTNLIIQSGFSFSGVAYNVTVTTIDTKSNQAVSFSFNRVTWSETGKRRTTTILQGVSLPKAIRAFEKAIA